MKKQNQREHVENHVTHRQKLVKSIHQGTNRKRVDDDLVAPGILHRHLNRGREREREFSQLSSQDIVGTGLCRVGDRKPYLPTVFGRRTTVAIGLCGDAFLTLDIQH